MTPKPEPPSNSNLSIPEMLKATFYACGYLLTDNVGDKVFEFTKYEPDRILIVMVLINETIDHYKPATPL